MFNEILYTNMHTIIITSASLFKVLITLSKASFSSLNFPCWPANLSLVFPSASSCILLDFSSSSLHLCSCVLRSVSHLLSSCFNVFFSLSTLSYCLRTYKILSSYYNYITYILHVAAASISSYPINIK